ncbi:MAG TPA: hypothetical protein VK550_27150 [Polyangiaceae bacterium]|nr:hypothetical protein [Polyangiaceae bacterium]
MSLEIARERLAVLAQAQGSVELAPVGIAAVVTETCRAYRELIADPAALRALKSDITVLARSGPGARRIYAALLLREIDREAGTDALASMSTSNEACDLALGGCTVMSSSVGDAVAHLLGRSPGLEHGG